LIAAAKNFFALLRRYHNVALFFGGFLFDVVTIVRIDAALDLLLQLTYLAALTVILLLQYREHAGQWHPGPQVARAWQYNVEILHFCYGALLSSYTILYFKSTSGSRGLVFLLAVVVLMGLNEMPQVRRIGHRLRLGLYAFCLASYMIFLVPILIGRMGGWVFLLSLGLTAGLVWGVAGLLARRDDDKKARQKRLFLPAGAVLGLIAVLYVLKLIPPVPLSVKFADIYHGVAKTADGYLLTTPRPPWYRFWKKESRPFLARPGDEIYYFLRLYAPARFRHQVRLRWQSERGGKFVTTDVVPMSVTGGRAAGFRGFAVKAHFEPGRWRVIAETEDGRAIGSLSFDIIADPATDDRPWLTLKQ
jgi:hypothetical protein